MQKYENYWSTTMALTDFKGEKFNKSLQIIIDFVEKNKHKSFSNTLYEDLQESVNKYLKINDISVRKVINTYVKLGFLNYNLKGVHDLSEKYLKTEDPENKRILFSKIVYSNSSFNRSVTVDSKQKEMNFLIKTLTHVKELKEDDLIALMTINDTTSYPKGYLTRLELDKAKEYAKIINFKDRKYNQVQHLFSILSFLEDLAVNRKEKNICFEEDKDLYLVQGKNKNDKPRDPYLHKLYKHELKKEVKGVYDKERCMAEKLDYPSLIASHIRPFRNSDDYQAYDSNNGLLLSRNLDYLFDRGYITFLTNGQIKIFEELSEELYSRLNKEEYKIDIKFLNESRKLYLEYHNREIFRGRM